MKVKKGFNLRQVCGQNLIVAEGKENMDFSNIISMNESSALLWDAIKEREFTTEDLAQILQNEYQIDDDTPLPHEQAMRDAATLVAQWREAGIIEE